MCGICGFIKYSGKNITADDVGILERMNRTLVHRGPDAQNILLFDNIALGFNRLSIIGLENGMQPIYNEDESLILICNGEIFNYVELKKDLENKGHKFRTNTDVEVILHLYEEKGHRFLNQLNGQFAFVLYDRKKQIIFCARDQLGIIPFFYTYVKKTFIFGSEIKAILQHPFVSKNVDEVGLDQVLTFPGLISPRTMFKNIHSLENGHFLTISFNGKISDEEYWDLPFQKEFNDCKIVEADYLDELHYLFEKSVKMRLRSDVETGVYLSGGLDSSMIGMKVSELNRFSKQKAFSIIFPDSQISEEKYQNIIAEKCGAELYQKTFYNDDISKGLRRAILHSECPIKETYNTASLNLSKAVRENGLKVILSGEGADEFFAGYVGYRFDKMRRMGLNSGSISEKEHSLRNRIWGSTDFFYETNFSDIENEKKRLYSEGLRHSFDEINCLNHFVINKSKLHRRDMLSRRSYVDYKLRLVDHLISDHGDRMAMANSVEIRYPFLDKEIVEFTTRIPSELKLHDLTEKYILRKLASKNVPKEILHREKFGFVAPGSPFLLRSNIEYINDLLSYNTIKRQGYFDPDFVENLKNTYRQDNFSINVPFETDFLLVVITFGIFLEHFIEK
ncbi:asparagine synthase (glutamine-hydrolyzing) [Maribacter sp. 2307UL18-2]|uniref:asparagine synthase (glutamine-hydrolyzing) n=1 Tax=Maribacter sp. 2307UL18-2 TaxID=3386274 RepID=UPI0039BC69E9